MEQASVAEPLLDVPVLRAPRAKTCRRVQMRMPAAGGAARRGRPVASRYLSPSGPARACADFWWPPGHRRRGGIGVMFAMRDGPSSPAPAAVASSITRRQRRSPQPVDRCAARARRRAPPDLQRPRHSSPRRAPLPATASLEDVVSRILPAVGSITAGQSRGTGFFIRPDQVLTNAHVVQGQTSVTMQVGSTTYNARVMTVSTGSDLALLQVYNANPNQPVLHDGLGVPRTCRTGSHRRRLGAWRALEHGDARHRQRRAGRSATSRCCRPTPRSIPATAEDHWSIAPVW